MQKNSFLDNFHKHYLCWAFILASIVSLLNSGIFLYLIGHLFYIDTDCYTRALRLIDWLNDFQWQEKIFPYFNPPQGFVLHFTRLCDVLWLILSLPFLFFMPIKEAVFLGGLFFSPLFMALSLSVVFWGIRAYLPCGKNNKLIYFEVCLVLIYFINKLSTDFDPVRPDHHALMNFVFSCNIAILLNGLIHKNIKHFFLAGILSGLGVWAASAPDGFFVIFTMEIVLIANWIFYKHSIDELSNYNLGCFLSLLVAWLINFPYGGWHVVSLSRLSILHIIFMILLFVAFSFIKKSHLKTIQQKILMLGSWGLGVCFIMLCIFGIDIFFTPLHTPQVWDYCIKYVSETQHVDLCSYETLFILLGLGTAIWLIKSNRRPVYAIDLLICACCAACISVIYRRFFPFFSMVFLFLCGIALLQMLSKAQTSLKYKCFAFGYLMLPMLFLLAFYMHPEPLQTPPLRGTALVDMLDAPEIVFYQDIDVVGAPYHPNQEGIVDNYTMWFTTDENVLKELLKKHHVQVLYLDTNNFREDYFINPIENTDKLYGKVISGHDLYPWMKRLGDGYYEIDYSLF